MRSIKCIWLLDAGYQIYTAPRAFGVGVATEYVLWSFSSGAQLLSALTLLLLLLLLAAAAASAGLRLSGSGMYPPA
jgi:hypothetical protein